MKKGFTLIELLVVIAIIAILAAILFPVFAQAREKARQTSCLSNMKNIGTAIMLYTDDNHETYPMSYGPVSGDTYKHYWPAKIFPYAKDWKIFYCPSHWNTYNKDLPDDGTYGASSQGKSALSAGYTANAYLLAYSGHTIYPSSPVKMARVKSPSNVIAVYEASSWGMGDNDLANNGWYSAYLPGTGSAGIATTASLSGEQLSDYNDGRHNAGINIAYADGHAAYEKSADVYSWINTTSKNPFRPTTW